MLDLALNSLHEVGVKHPAAKAANQLISALARERPCARCASTRWTTALLQGWDQGRELFLAQVRHAMGLDSSTVESMAMFGETLARYNSHAQIDGP